MAEAVQWQRAEGALIAGADRAFGYGLKTGKGFHHTNLGAIGPARRNTNSDLPKP